MKNQENRLVYRMGDGESYRPTEKPAAPEAMPKVQAEAADRRKDVAQDIVGEDPQEKFAERVQAAQARLAKLKESGQLEKSQYEDYSKRLSENPKALIGIIEREVIPRSEAIAVAQPQTPQATPINLEGPVNIDEIAGKTAPVDPAETQKFLVDNGVIDEASPIQRPAKETEQTADAAPDSSEINQKSLSEAQAQIDGYTTAFNSFKERYSTAIQKLVDLSKEAPNSVVKPKVEDLNSAVSSAEKALSALKSAVDQLAPNSPDFDKKMSIISDQMSNLQTALYALETGSDNAVDQVSQYEKDLEAAEDQALAEAEQAAAPVAPTPAPAQPADPLNIGSVDIAKPDEQLPVAASRPKSAPESTGLSPLQQAQRVFDNAKLALRSTHRVDLKILLDGGVTKNEKENAAKFVARAAALQKAEKVLGIEAKPVDPENIQARIDVVLALYPKVRAKAEIQYNLAKKNLDLLTRQLDRDGIAATKEAIVDELNPTAETTLAKVRQYTRNWGVKSTELLKAITPEQGKALEKFPDALDYLALFQMLTDNLKNSTLTADFRQKLQDEIKVAINDDLKNQKININTSALATVGESIQKIGETQKRLAKLQESGVVKADIASKYAQSLSNGQDIDEAIAAVSTLYAKELPIEQILALKGSASAEEIAALRAKTPEELAVELESATRKYAEFNYLKAKLEGLHNDGWVSDAEIAQVRAAKPETDVNWLRERYLGHQTVAAVTGKDDTRILRAAAAGISDPTQLKQMTEEDIAKANEVYDAQLTDSAAKLTPKNAAATSPIDPITAEVVAGARQNPTEQSIGIDTNQAAFDTNIPSEVEKSDDVTAKKLADTLAKTKAEVANATVEPEKKQSLYFGPKTDIDTSIADIKAQADRQGIELAEAKEPSDNVEDLFKPVEDLRFTEPIAAEPEMTFDPIEVGDAPKPPKAPKITMGPIQVTGADAEPPVAAN